MYKAHGEYPQTKEFLEHAAAVCGRPFALYGEHEQLGIGTELIFDVREPDNSIETSVAVGIYAVTLRGQGAHTQKERGDKLLKVLVQDKLIEGIVKRSANESFYPGDSIIALASLGCDALIMNTADQGDLNYARETFKWPYFTHHLR